MSKPITGQVKTTPKPYMYPKKPENISKKMPVKVVKKKKVSRGSMPNVQGTESFKAMTGGAGMNDENKLRKIRRAQQGL